MRIRSITPLAVSLPLATPIKMSNVTIATTENLLVRIVDSDGIVGWGEACSAPMMTGETPESMLAAVTHMRNALEGREVEDVTTFGPAIEATMYGNASAKSAIEMALYDIAGKRARVPVFELLGGAKRTRLSALWMLADGQLDADVATARRMVDEGFVAFKVKVGKDAAGDLARAKAVRAAVGAGIRISADANQGYTRAQSLAFAAGAADAGLDFIEQPVDGYDLEAMAATAAATPVLICADEGIHRLSDLDRHHAAGAAHGASLKTIKLGGLTAVMTAGRRMAALGMHINLAGKVADSSVASAAIVHLGAALPQLDWDVSITCPYLSADIVREPIRLQRGHAHLLERPGLGVEVDEARVLALTGGRAAA